MKYLSKLNDAEDVTVQDNREENNEVKTINYETLPSPSQHLIVWLGCQALYYLQVFTINTYLQGVYNQFPDIT